MVTLRNNNRRSNFRRNDRNHKRNGDASKFKSHFPSKDGFQRTVPSRNNYNSSKLDRSSMQFIYTQVCEVLATF